MPTFYIDPVNDLTSAQISTELRVMTGRPGPGQRHLVKLCNDGKLPMLEHRGRYVICQRKNLPTLAEALGLLPEPEQTTPLLTAPESVGAVVHRRADTPRKAA